MMRLAGVLLTVFCCAGCAATAGTAAGPARFPVEGWRQMQARLAKAPLELRLEVTRAAEARNASAGPAHQLPHENGDARKGLLDLLTRTDRKALLPDGAFEQTRRVVLGENRPLGQGYAELLAAYLLDQDFACRQPAYHGYFQRRYHGEGAAGCSGEVPFSVMASYQGAEVLWLDPKRVKAVHLLFAGKSGNAASRFGHAALRLVVCPEGRTAADECDANLAGHLVLGFQAHVDDLAISTWKALAGDYRAYLYANHFMDVYHEYAIAEFREIYSLPLRLDAAQRDSLVRGLSDIHWRYAGNYSYFSNNCASMLQDALRVAWPALAADAVMKDGFLRPDSFFEALRSRDISEGDKLHSLEAAERDGYYFSSTKEFYLRALEVVKGAMGSPGFTTLESYLETDPIARREARSADSAYMARLASDRHLREAQLMLEEYACVKGERLLAAEAARYFLNGDFLESLKEVGARLPPEQARVFQDCLMAPLVERARPKQSIAGIPVREAVPATAVETTACHSEEAMKLLRESVYAAGDTGSQEWRRLKDISRYWSESWTNVKMLKQL